MDPKLSLHTPQTAGEEIKQHETAVSHTRIQTALLALALLAGGNGVAQAQQAPQTTGSGTESTRILQSGELPKPVTVTSGGKHTDIKPGKDGKYTITTSVEPSSPSASLQGTKDYGKIASNGQKFEDLEKLSTEEMGKLPEKIQMELEAWIDNENNKKKKTIVSTNNENNQKKETIASIDKRSQKLIEEINELNSTNSNYALSIYLNEREDLIIKYTKSPEIFKKYILTSGLDKVLKLLKREGKPPEDQDLINKFLATISA